MGDGVSVLDIAWFIYANRLANGGYPLQRLHPRVFAWKAKLGARPEFAKEVASPPHVVEMMAAARRAQEPRRSLGDPAHGYSVRVQ
jgi:glutathione S-transferase